MRRFPILIISAMLTVPMFSQDVVVVSKDSLTKSLDLDNLRKIAFKDGNLITTYSDGSTVSLQLTESDKLQLTVPTESDVEASGEERLYTIYDLSGRVVKTNKETGVDEPFDLNGLSPGIYLLRTSSSTIKIVK